MTNGEVVGSSKRGLMVLGGILVFLLLLLVAVSYFFVSVLVPAGLPEQTESAGGMTWVRSIYGFGASADEQLLGPTAVAVGPDGTIYATDPQRARVLAFHPDGTFKGLIHTGMGGTGEGQIGRPGDIAVDERGDIYISDVVNGKIIVFDDGFQFIREWPAIQAIGIEVIGETLFAREGGEIVQYTLEGEERSRVGERGRGNGAALEPAGGLTADGDRIYVADALNQSIKAFTREGELIWAVPEKPVEALVSMETSASAESTETSESVESTETSGENAADVVDLPQDVVFDAAGRLVAVDAFSFKVLVIDPETGRIEADYGEDGTDDGYFMYPSGIAYDASRDWFVIADTSNDRIQVVRIEGSGGGVGQAATRALSSPFRVCAVPFVALILALGLVILTGRRRGSAKQG